LYGSAPAIVVSAIWGLSFVAARAVLSTLTPILLATIRFSIASLVFIPIIVWELKHGRVVKLLATIRFSIASLVFIPIIVWELKHGRVVKLRDLMELALLGLLSVSVYFCLQYTGIKYAGAGISAPRYPHSYVN
jgi:drug/metabolite transporter (DMT)-like permease